MSELCKGCNGSLRGFGADLARGLCLSCQSSRPYHQDQDQDQDQGQDQIRARPLVEPCPGPGGNPPPSGDEEPELYALLRAHSEGKLAPKPVGVGEMPPHAGDVMAAISERMRFLMGLRLAVGDDRPLPYAASMAAEDAGVDKGTASKALNALVRGGVWVRVGTLPPTKPGLDGTWLYAPPVAVVVTLRRAA